MRKNDSKKEDKNSSNVLKGIISGIVGIGIGIGAKILYDEYKDKNKPTNKENKKEKTNQENKIKENVDKKEYQKVENINLKDKKQNKTLEKNEDVITLNENMVFANDENEVIESMICPINQTIMKDPVVTPYGITYERSAIEDWLKKNDTDPIAKKHLTKDMLVTNYALKSVIKEYLKQESQNQKIVTNK